MTPSTWFWATCVIRRSRRARCGPEPRPSFTWPRLRGCWTRSLTRSAPISPTWTPRATITEDMALRPLTPYGATKAAGEMLLSSYSSSYGIAGCALRFSNVYGPGMAEKDRVVPRLMRAARDGHGVEIYGDGTQIRDLVHVDDIVAGPFAAWKAKFTGPMILGAGESVAVNDILAAARSVTSAELPVTYVPPKPGEMPAVIVDISRARSIGYEPEQDLKSGLSTVWPEFAEAAQ